MEKSSESAQLLKLRTYEKQHAHKKKKKEGERERLSIANGTNCIPGNLIE